MTNMEQTIQELIASNQKLYENITSARNGFSRFKNMSLFCENREGIYYYRIIDSKRLEGKPIYKGRFEKSKEVQDIAAYQYFKRAADHAERNIKMLEELARNIVDVDPNVFPEEMPMAYQKQTPVIFQQTGIISIEEWRNRQRIFSDRNPEDKIHKTRDGWMVRSKSEAMWADGYSEMKIPYVYEAVRAVCGTRIAPDFDALNTRIYKEYIHEHFGKMDDLEYVQNNFLWRLFRYMKAGYTPGVDLIMTFESKYNPLTRDTILATLDHYFG